MIKLHFGALDRHLNLEPSFKFISGLKQIRQLRLQSRIEGYKFVDVLTNILGSLGLKETPLRHLLLLMWL